MSISGATRFVGRHREIASVKHQLLPRHLVTLTGPGGVGKSRLAARILEQDGDDGWLVDLADVTPDQASDARLVALEVGHRLGLRAGPGTGEGATVVEFLSGRPALLVLDNSDRVLPGVRLLVEDLLEHCPDLRVLVTSRETLGIAGERAVRLAPLSLPADLVDLTPETAGRSEAVRLFVDRAASVAPDFVLTQDNVEAVARLCAALDGLPLALELAAARSRELSPEAMLTRLRDRYRLLGPRFRDVPDRLGSLEASVTWSHDLCSPDEQRLWARLSVFAGGFELEAAEQVCSGDGIEVADVAGLLDSLVSKSVVVVDTEVEPHHHTMLDSIRAYGAARLADGDPAPWRERHGAWCAGLAQEFARAWIGPWQAWWLARMRRNHGNLVATLDSGHAERLRLLTDAEMYWVLTGSIAAAQHWFERVLLSGQGDPGLRFRARCISAYFSTLLADQKTARREVADLRTFAGADDPVAQAWLAQADGLLRLFESDLAAGAAVVRHGVQAAQQAGLVTLELNLRAVLVLLLFAPGDEDDHRVAVTETLTRATEVGDTFTRSFALWIEGTDARDAGDLDRAMELELEALALKWPLRDHLGLALVLEAMATIASLRGDLETTGRLLGTAARVWRRVGMTPAKTPYIRAERELAERIERGDVEPAFVRAYQEGRGTDGDITIAGLLGRRTSPTEGPDRQAALTAREREVAALVGEGLTNKQIASRLVISVRTVHGHMENILRKLGFGSRAQVAAWVAREGLSPPASGS